MSKVLITGSSDGLGLMAAQGLLAAGLEVVLHGRNQIRARDAKTAAPKAHGVVVGGLASIAETRGLAEQANMRWIDSRPSQVHLCSEQGPHMKIFSKDTKDVVITQFSIAPGSSMGLALPPRACVHIARNRGSTAHSAPRPSTSFMHASRLRRLDVRRNRSQLIFASAGTVAGSCWRSRTLHRGDSTRARPRMMA